ncbi:MAG: hypothetical protein M3460_24055, partial [Actinomycetota bacterium]|nr:hypothetical protein [Actinomycetota bacterium]
AWHGAEAGHGRLRSREVVVRAVGRGAAARPCTARLLLPGPGGAVAEALANSIVGIRAVADGACPCGGGLVPGLARVGRGGSRGLDHADPGGGGGRQPCGGLLGGCPGARGTPRATRP